MKRTILDTEHEEFRRSVRSFLDNKVAPHLEEYVEAKSLPRSFWLEAGKLGLLGLEIPESYGGSEAGDFRFNAVLSEELARISMGLASCVGIHTDVVAPYLVHLTSQEQRQKWLPGMVTGEILTAIAMTEPGAGSDLASLRTSAVREGDDFVINGAKTFITNGGSADLIVLAARTSADRSKGITLFGVETSAPGFSRGRKLDKVGQTESDTSELFFDDVRVPANSVLGDIGGGFGHMMTWLPTERLSAAVTNIAHASEILRETLEYCRTREAFNRPIGSFQANKFLLAELATTIDVSQAFVDQCIDQHRAGELTPVDAAKAKWWSAQVQNDVIDHCLQLHGGYGYMNDFKVARAWRDARVSKIWAGTNEIMKELIGRDLAL